MNIIQKNRDSIIPEFLEHILENFYNFWSSFFPNYETIKKIHVENFANSNLLELLELE